MDAADTQANLTPDGQRRIIADYLKAVGSRVNPEKASTHATEPPPTPPPPPPPRPELELHLSPRLRQTLARLLAGDSEKQVARHLQLSKNTVHVYVKALYRHFDVNSRGELLAKFVKC